MERLLKAYRVIRWLMFASLVITIFLLLKKPSPVAGPVEPDIAKLDAQSFQQKLEELESAPLSDASADELRFTAGEVNAAIEQSTAPQTAVLQAGPRPQVKTGSSAEAIPIKSTQVTFEGDEVKGQFLAQVYGRDLYITVAGHLGSRDGYATFDPTELKVGDLAVPVALVNPALQRKLAEPENRDKLKLPDFVKQLRVENGELVIRR
jgi:hypothetical protein